MQRRLIHLLQLCAISSAGAANETGALLPGEEVYQAACAQCHYAGEQTPNAPALTDSPLLKKPGLETARIILTGQANASMVDGELFGGIMPAMSYLSNEEIAAVVRYVRKSYAGIDEESPTVEQVETLRKGARAD
jgi:mono/diheme cytochrome c family protein